MKHGESALWTSLIVGVATGRGSPKTEIVVCGIEKQGISPEIAFSGDDGRKGARIHSSGCIFNKKSGKGIDYQVGGVSPDDGIPEDSSQIGRAHV